MKIVVLVIRDNELRRQVLSEVTEVGEISLGKRIWLAYPGFPGWWDKWFGNLLILKYNYYIQILLINTNPLIYICFIM